MEHPSGFFSGSFPVVALKPKHLYGELSKHSPGVSDRILGTTLVWPLEVVVLA